MTRSEASRINGAKSYGPVTPAGKARSALNSRKHGLCAKLFLLPLEDPSAFEELHAAYLEEFAPQSVAEQDCVEEMVAAVYRQRRLWALEAASITNHMDVMASEVDEKYESIPHVNRIALAFDYRAAAKLTPELYLRYDAHFSRAFDRALKRLENIRKLRAANSASANAPTANSTGCPIPIPMPNQPAAEPDEPKQGQQPQVASGNQATAGQPTLISTPSSTTLNAQRTTRNRQGLRP
jgi:hypothetical protein